MKKIFLLFALFVGISTFSHAQKFALIDMDYILKNISSFETAQGTYVSVRIANVVRLHRKTNVLLAIPHLSMISVSSTDPI